MKPVSTSWTPAPVSTRIVFVWPPAYVPASNTVMSCAGASSCAATRPEMPAPMMAMRGLTPREFRTSRPFGSRSLARMRVFVIGDMEGVAGICRWNQVAHDGDAYKEGRGLYTGEMNAAAAGAFDAGATEVVLMDCHGAGGGRSFTSLVPDGLHERWHFVVQTEWTEYTGILEEGCDAALFVGQHARAGSELGVMSHTVSSTQWHDLRFNG